MAEYIWRCDLSKQYQDYQEEIDTAAKRVLSGGIYTLGKEVRLFEKEFAEYIGRRYGIGVASGTDALILALKASGIKKGDEVITTTYAPAPVPTAIILAGGVPVFADIERETCLIDPEAVKNKVTNKTRCIIAVHLFGSVCDMKEILLIAGRHHLKVIEDAAQAHGSRCQGKKTGGFAPLACFSFYPTKNLGGYGDGGIILTDSKKKADLIMLLRNYGKRYNPFDSEIVGYNSRLDELQAAILRVKLRHLDSMNRKRRELIMLYKAGLKDVPLVFLKEGLGVISNYHILTVLCGKGRDRLARFLEEKNIQTNIYYPRPLHRMRAFREYARPSDKFPVSERICKEALALPLYPELEEEKVLFVIKNIRRYFLGR